MHDAAKIYVELFKQAVQSAEVQEIKKLAATPALMKRLAPWLAGGAGLAGLGIGLPVAYQAGRAKGEEGTDRSRLLSFGAGTVAGLTIPKLLKQLRQSTGMGLAPGSFGGGEFTSI